MTDSELQVAVNKLLSDKSFNIAISSFLAIPTLVLPDTPEARAILEAFKKLSNHN